MEKYYVSGCRDDGEATVTCDDSVATFWTLYARDDKGLSQGIIDLAFREDAEAAMAVYVERDALQEQVQKLAALAEERRIFIVNGAEMGYIELPVFDEDPATATYQRCLLNPKFAADAAIREVGAKAVDAFALAMQLPSTVTPQDSREYSDQIRAGEQP